MKNYEKKNLNKKMCDECEMKTWLNRGGNANVF